MKTRTFIVGLLSLLTLPTFIACDDDDFTYYTDMATVENEDGRLILQSDNCGELIPENPGLLASFDADNENQRIIAAFNFIDKDNRSNYGVELYDIYRVLTKDVYQMPADDETKNDSIGNDPINVSEAWFGGNYLNMEFYIPVKGNSSTAHFINLVVDDVAPATNDTVYVTLRHNAYDDKPGEGRVPGDYRWAWGNVSFDLASLLPEGATSVPVKLTWTGYKGGNFGETEVHTESGVFTLSAETKALAGGLNDSRSNAESATAQTPTVTCR